MGIATQIRFCCCCWCWWCWCWYVTGVTVWYFLFNKFQSFFLSAFYIKLSSVRNIFVGHWELRQRYTNGIVSKRWSQLRNFRQDFSKVTQILELYLSYYTYMCIFQFHNLSTVSLPVYLSVVSNCICMYACIELIAIKWYISLWSVWYMYLYLPSRTPACVIYGQVPNALVIVRLCLSVASMFV